MTSLNILSLEMASRFLSHSNELINVLENTSKTAFSKVDVDDFTNQVKQLKNKADEVVNGGSSVTKRRIAALNKWAKKFDEHFVNHLTGDVGIKKITENGSEFYKITNKGQGGHFITRYVKVNSFLIPPNARSLADVLDDTPFKCKITIKSKYGKEFVKSAPSSMFPRNWDLTRIKEEVAFVYEVAQKNSSMIKVEATTTAFGKIEGNTSNGFKILIEVDINGNIMNSYPKL